MLFAMLGDSEAEKIWSGVVPNGVQIMLRQRSRTEIHVRVQNTFLARIQRLDQFLSIWAEDHTESTTWSASVGVVLEKALLFIRLRQDLPCLDRVHARRDGDFTHFCKNETC